MATIRNNHIGRGNMACPNCSTILPAKISQCVRCNYAFYKITPHGAEHGRYGKYLNIMTPREQLEAMQTKHDFELDRLSARRFVKHIKKGNIKIIGRKFVIDINAISEILSD